MNGKAKNFDLEKWQRDTKRRTIPFCQHQGCGNKAFILGFSSMPNAAVCHVHMLLHEQPGYSEKFVIQRRS